MEVQQSPSPAYHDVNVQSSTPHTTSDKGFSHHHSTSQAIKTWHIVSSNNPSEPEHEHGKTIRNDQGQPIYSVSKKEKHFFTQYRLTELILNGANDRTFASVKLNAKTEQHAMCVREDPKSRRNTLQEIMVSWQGDAFHFIIDRRGVKWVMDLQSSHFGDYSLTDEDDSSRVLARYNGTEGRLVFFDASLGEKLEVGSLMGIVAIEEGLKIARKVNPDGRRGNKFGMNGSGGGTEGSAGAGFGGLM